MSTTFSARFTVSGKNAHEELDAVVRTLCAIAGQLDHDHSNYAGAVVACVPVHDSGGQRIGDWRLD